ncbi:MAG: penicillin acylase family protein [Myxococcota bacterium]|nr:penicillin acylase family protein [Myxococcota bacterium]
MLRGQETPDQAPERAAAQESGTIFLRDLGGPVEVVRDSRGIPHLEARREQDVFFGLGFVHAQDRIEQMLWMRDLALGMTARSIGPRGLPADRIARTLGFGRLARRAARVLDPETRSILEAYVAGINAGLDRLALAGPSAGGDPGRSTVEPWQVSDSLAIMKLLSWTMSNGIETSLVLDDLIARLGGRWARPFRPGPSTMATSGPAFEASLDGWMGVRGTGSSGRGFSAGQRSFRSVDLHGGAAWVISGRYTKSGEPLLVANLHLSVTAPALIYAASLRVESFELVGATIPGLPIFWLGRNSEMAWAALPARAVTVDLFTETVRWSKETYRSQGQWVPLEVRHEVIEVRTESGMEQVVWPVRSTRHGPLIDRLLAAEDVADPETKMASGADRRALSVSWSGGVEGEGMSSLIRMAHSRSEADLLRGLRAHLEPVLSVVYAARSGRAGVQLVGWLPRRLLPTSLVPVPGRLALFDWTERIPFDALPHLSFDASKKVQPAAEGRAFLAVADGGVGNIISDAPIEWMWRSRETQQRLEAILEKMVSQETGRRAQPRGAPAGGLDLKSGWSTLNDEGGYAARDVVPAIIWLANQSGGLRPEAREVLSALAEWDGVFAEGSRGAAIYQTLIRHLMVEVFHPAFGKRLFDRYIGLPHVKPNEVLGEILISFQRTGAVSEEAEFRDMVAAVARALRQTWASLSHQLGVSREDWMWGGLHRLQFFGFSGTPGEPLEALSSTGVGGARRTLSYTGFNWVRGFEVEEASSAKIAMDLAYPDRLLWSLAPGQSEQSGHPHHQDGLRRWSEGKAFLLETRRLLLEDEAGSRLMLEPAS